MLELLQRVMGGGVERVHLGWNKYSSGALTVGCLFQMQWWDRFKATRIKARQAIRLKVEISEIGMSRRI